MFVSSTNYYETVKSIATEDGDLLMAVSFWGRSAESIVHPRSSGHVKIICNLQSGATNPDTIFALLNRNGITVKQHDRLHAKVIIGSKAAVVGSANLSSNGLNLEGIELQGWEEAGLLTKDTLQVEEIKQWFDSLWIDAQDIRDNDIDEARKKWAMRRSSRIHSSSGAHNGFSLENFTYSDFLDRPVFLAIYTDHLSDEAKDAYRENESALIGKTAVRPSNLPPIYEGWPGLPKDAQLIDIYFGPRGGLKCYGVFTRTHDIIFKYKDGSDGHLAICRKESSIMGYNILSKDLSKIADFFQSHIEAIWKSPLSVGDEGGKCIPLSDALKLCA